MLEYFPWSTAVLNNSLEQYQKNVFSILDIEVGGACNLACIYCDSPDRSKLSEISNNDLSRLFSSKKIEWLFLCGLGEPFAEKNRSQFMSFIQECKMNNIQCSAFTNLLALDDEILKFVDDGLLNLLIKCDSLHGNKLNKIYGSSRGEKCLDQIQKLKQHVIVSHGQTNVGLSIVPTSLNYEEIPELIQFSQENDFYPLIGDLEDSGMAQRKFNDLKLPPSKLWNLRKDVENILGEPYKLPICPSVISGIHINHERNIVVDKSTGLSCHWFWLKAPEIMTLCKLEPDTTYEDISRHIFGYRNKKLKSTEKYAYDAEELPIGGCGGDIKSLLTRYIQIQKKLIENKI